MSDLDRPIFLLGCPRSGTTLLRVMLNAHTRIAMPPENRFVMPTYYRRHRFVKRDRATAVRKLANSIAGSRTGFKRLGIPKQEFVNDLVELGANNVADAFRHAFSDYARRQGKPRWGDKRPVYYSFINELNAMFPDAQFIHLVRDGRSCVASLKRPPFSFASSRAIVTWLNAMHACRRSASRLGTGQIVDLRYEDLVTSTEESLRELCLFLGETFEVAMLHPEQIVTSSVPAHYQQHGQIAVGVNTKSLRTWEQELSPDEIACLELLGRRYFRQFDYDTVAPRSLPTLLTLRCTLGHLIFRLGLPATRWLDRETDSDGATGRMARWTWRRLRPRRFLVH